MEEQIESANALGKLHRVPIIKRRRSQEEIQQGHRHAEENTPRGKSMVPWNYGRRVIQSTKVGGFCASQFLILSDIFFRIVEIRIR